MTDQKIRKWKNLAIDRFLVDQIDELISIGMFPSKQQAVNYMIRKYLENYKTTEELENENQRLKERLAELES